MQISYDMGTGRVIETPRQEQKQDKRPAQETYPLPELRLQEINSSKREVQRFPPDLVYADLNRIMQDPS